MKHIHSTRTKREERESDASSKSTIFLHNVCYINDGLEGEKEVSARIFL